MKTLHHLMACVTCMIFTAAPSYGQTPVDTGYIKLDMTRDLDAQLLPLDSIINIAILHAPLLKQQEADIRKNQYLLQATRRTWSQYTNAYTNYSIGNQGIVVNNLESTSSQLNGYRAGVSFTMPLYQIIGRPKNVKAMKEQVSSSEYRRQVLEQDLTRQVMSEYINLVAAQKLLRVKAEALQNANLTRDLAERQFKSGQLGVNAFGQMNEMASKAATEYEFVNRDFNISYLQFEALVGVKMTQLLK